MRLSFGTRRFAPSPGLTVLVLVLCVMFIALGRWQWRRGNLHAAEHASFERGAREVLTLGSRPLDGRCPPISASVSPARTIQRISFSSTT